MQSFLMEDYYNNTGDAQTNGYGLKDSARKLIDDAILYLGGFEYNNYYSTKLIYKLERGTKRYNDTRPTNWEEKVALMYPSDMYMTYGNGVNNGYYKTPMNSSMCGVINSNTSWIYKTNVLEGNTSYQWTWFLPSNSNHAYIVLYSDNTHLGTNGASYAGGVPTYSLFII